MTLEAWEYDTPLPAIATTAQRWADWSDAFQKIYRAAEVIARTPLAPKEMQGNTDTVAACMMKGYELGLDPLDALANMYVVHGRVGFYAEFMRRRILQAGHKIRVVESTDQRCVMEGTRRGEQPQRAQFTAEQARKAQLNLGNYPADKLVARATSRLCRQVFPDVLSGSLIVEDILDGLVPAADDTEPPPEPPTEPAGPALTRKRRPRQPKAASTQAPTQPAPQPAHDDDDLLLDEPGENTAQPAGDAVTSSISPSQPVATRDDDDLLAAEHQPPPQTGAGLPADKGGTRTAEHGTPPPASPDQEEFDIPQPADENPEPITAPQLTKLSILLRERGLTDRETRHDFVAAAIDRYIASAKELTKDEASYVIDLLENDKPTTAETEGAQD